ncbi:hypothetical protein OUZ56_021956 [Daphnia magna]|uniref:Uncharacterized protein n=1 Tax=Daphnia magna TaxID=35525 RepID=A0ABR0AUZ6_9CRUS|nr:hypothetical protein OUZ56_021956 [Daphnia magna]
MGYERKPETSKCRDTVRTHRVLVIEEVAVTQTYDNNIQSPNEGGGCPLSRHAYNFRTFIPIVSGLNRKTHGNGTDKSFPPNRLTRCNQNSHQNQSNYRRYEAHTKNKRQTRNAVKTKGERNTLIRSNFNFERFKMLFNKLALNRALCADTIHSALMECIVF